MLFRFASLRSVFTSKSILRRRRGRRWPRTWRWRTRKSRPGSRTEGPSGGSLLKGSFRLAANLLWSVTVAVHCRKNRKVFNYLQQPSPLQQSLWLVWTRLKSGQQTPIPFGVFFILFRASTVCSVPFLFLFFDKKIFSVVGDWTLASLWCAAVTTEPIKLPHNWSRRRCISSIAKQIWTSTNVLSYIQM